jgi:hypothetical protein
MRKLCLCLLILAICLTVGPLTGTGVALGQEKDNIGFEWGFGAMSGSAKDPELASITRDTTLKSGDQVKMIVKLTKECFVYLIHEESDGEITLRFPYDLEQFSTDYKIGKNYYIPKGRPWFQLDDKVGKESFYLLASPTRLTDLENLLKKYRSSSASAKTALAKDIVSEIRNVRKRFKTFATTAERPISIGGNVRGTQSPGAGRRPDVATITTEISANNFYGKTITVDHK